MDQALGTLVNGMWPCPQGLAVRGGDRHLNRELHFSSGIGGVGDSSDLDLENSPKR